MMKKVVSLLVCPVRDHDEYMLSALHHTDIHIEMLPTICVFAVYSSAIHLSMKKTYMSLSLHEE